MGLSFSTICARMRAHAIYIGEGLQFPPPPKQRFRPVRSDSIQAAANDARTVYDRCQRQ